MPTVAHVGTSRPIDSAAAGTAAAAAARGCQVVVPDAQARFALLISDVGRRLVLKQRTEEAVEAVSAVVGSKAVLAGFYSYGEISPTSGAQCRLHNQATTLTTLSEP